jgi:threonine dehydrogenase-like Zn-dependent dehydrogenase
MRAVVYHGPGQKAWEEVPDPEIIGDDDVIVRVDAATICGTDLHILKGDVHGAPATLHLEDQWIRDITITTGLVDTFSTPTLMRLVTSGQIDAKRFITHHFGLDEFEEAYDVFSRAADTGALKVVLSR